MQQVHFNALKALLLKLMENAGYFIIKSGYLGAEKNRADEVYCQLLKVDKDGPARFESVSHYSDKTLGEQLNDDFTRLGFSLEKKGNYFKDIPLHSAGDIENTATEIEYIFEKLYKTDKTSPYEFEEEIEISI